MCLPPRSGGSLAVLRVIRMVSPGELTQLPGGGAAADYGNSNIAKCFKNTHE